MCWRIVNNYTEKQFLDFVRFRHLAVCPLSCFIAPYVMHHQKWKPDSFDLWIKTVSSLSDIVSFQFWFCSFVLFCSDSVCASATVRTMTEEVKKSLSYADSAMFKCYQLPLGGSEVSNVDPLTNLDKEERMLYWLSVSLPLSLNDSLPLPLPSFSLLANSFLPL